MKSKKNGLVVLLLTLIMIVTVACSDHNAEPEMKDNNSNSQNTEEGKNAEEGNNAKDQKPANVNAEGFPIVKEPIELTMFGGKPPTHVDWGDMGMFRFMEEQTNIKFKFNTPPVSGIDQQRNLIMASGDYPDILMKSKMTPMDEVEYGSEGAFIPLNDLLDKYAPNFQKLIEAHPEVLPSITTPDGNIYSLPMVQEGAQPQVFESWINGKWMDHLNITETPQTTEELYELLKTFLENDANGNGKPDELPLSVGTPALENLNKMLLPAFGIVSDEQNYHGIFVDDNDQVKYAYIQEQYKEFLMYLNRLWKENLLDHSIFTHTNQQLFADGTEGRVGVFPGPSPTFVLRSQTPEEEMSNYLLQPLTSPNNDKKINTGTHYIRRGAFSITSANEHPEASVRWADYLYSDEGSRMVQLGMEGEQWEWLNEEQSEWKMNVPEGMNRGKVRGQGSPGVGPGFVPQWIKDDFIKKEPNEKAAWIFAQAESLLEYRRIPFPLVYLTPEEQKQLGTLRSDLSSYYNEWAAKFIVGDVSFDQWDKYVKTIEDIGVDKMVEIFQAAYDRYLEAANE